MSYRKGNEELKFDVRMRQFNLENKVVNESEVKNFEASLSDSADNAESLSIDEDLITRDEPADNMLGQNQAPQGFAGMAEQQNQGGENSGFGSGGFNF